LSGRKNKEVAVMYPRSKELEYLKQELRTDLTRLAFSGATDDEAAAAIDARLRHIEIAGGPHARQQIEVELGMHTSERRIVDAQNVRISPLHGSFLEYSQKESALVAQSQGPSPSETTESPQTAAPVSASINIPPGPGERLLSSAIAGEYRYAILGLSLGILAIIGGVVLGLNGVAGSTSWTASLLGLESKINDAGPGVVLFVVGLFMIHTTRPRVKLRDLK
jgi:hypothetical protein